MSLADDLKSLRDHTLAELVAAHDYFSDTRFAWDLVNQAIAGGAAFSYQNIVTGTVTTQVELPDKATRYVAEHAAEASFQQFLSIFEAFFFDLLRLWFLAYPGNLVGKKVDFKAVLEEPDRDALILSVINKELNEVLYERPTAWFAYLEERLKLGCPTVHEIERIAEAKASRDVLVHNRGVAGKSYAAKAGQLARYQSGQRIDLPEPYHRAVWELLCKVVGDLATAALVKAA